MAALSPLYTEPHLGFRMRSLLYLFIVLSLAGTGRSQEWPYYGSDAGGTKYSPLEQINRSNVTELKTAWTYETGDSSDGTGASPVRSAFEATPLVIDGVMYFPTAFNRLIALDAETGKELWTFDPGLDMSRIYTLFIHRGVAYWTDGESRRIYYGTIDGRLYAIDAANGKPVESFGDNGMLNLRAGVADDYPRAAYGMTSPPMIFEDLVICGAWSSDGLPQGPSGDIRAFDVHSGKQVWRFHTIPREGEFGNDTWEGDSWKDRGGTNMWSIASLDEERGIVYLPLTSPASDFYGGDRKGENLFGDALVALDARTGERIWHFQTIHHNLWDYDLPAQPNLVTVLRGGKEVPAVAQVTKMGFTFLFDRRDGKPLFEIEERKVPPSSIPGEEAWPTQPFPVKPPPFARQSMKPDELTDVTPESREFCEKLSEGAIFGELYTPIAETTTILFPGTNGGANWGGASVDPETATLYVNSMDVGMISRMVERPQSQSIPWLRRGLNTPNSRYWDNDLNPCQKPPWGHLTAIDLNTGEFRWRSVLGVVDALLEKGVPPTGTSNLGGSIVTAGGLVFIGATNDSRFRAFDKDTGKELWVTKLPASAHATPMTFRGKSGKQFVVIAAGGGNKYNKVYGDTLVAFALPE